MFENYIKTTKQHCWIISIEQNNAIFFLIILFQILMEKKEEALFPLYIQDSSQFPYFSLKSINFPQKKKKEPNGVIGC